jgi:DNA-binding MarR family transcriptional regulator
MTDPNMDDPEPDMESEDSLGFLTHDTARAVTLAFGTIMAPLGLTRPQVRVLVWVDHIPGITQADLAERLFTSPMALTGLIDRMENKGLVKRVDDPNDRRVRRIYLTDGAIRLKPEMAKITEKFRSIMYSGIAPEDVVTAVNVLKTLTANLRNVKEEAKE